MMRLAELRMRDRAIRTLDGGVAVVSNVKRPRGERDVLMIFYGLFSIN